MNAATPSPEFTNPNTVPTLAEFKGWWNGATAEDQQRWWDSQNRRDVELQDLRTTSRYPWRQDPHTLSLEQELADTKAELAVAHTALRDATTASATSTPVDEFRPHVGIRVLPLSALSTLFGTQRPPEPPEDAVPAKPSPAPCGSPFCSGAHATRVTINNPGARGMTQEELTEHLERLIRWTTGGAR